MPRRHVRQYERTVKPLVTSEEFDKTVAAIKAFAEGDGPKLQRYLVADDASKKHTSYISGATPKSRERSA